MQGLVLIGPPGAGKSTILPRLGRELHKKTLDTDLCIASEHKKSLADIAKEKGSDFLVEEEGRCLLSCELPLFIVATSGSVIFTDKKDYLREHALVVWIDVPPEETLNFLENDATERAIVAEGDLLENMQKRQDLYRAWSHHRVAREDKSRKEITEEIANLWRAQA
jgi:shikimate kinase